MKVIGRAQILEEPNVTLSVEDDLAAALNLGDDAQLYAVALTRDGLRPGPYQESAEASWITIIASPFSTAMWSKLIRVSVTVDPAPGSLQKLLRAFNELGLLCRFIESTNGIDLRSFKPFDSRRTAPGAIGDDMGPESHPLIIPSTIAVVEVADVLGRPSKKDPKEYRKLRSRLRDLAMRESSDRGGNEEQPSRETSREMLRRLLEKVMRRLDNDGAGSGEEQESQVTVDVDWISRMATLNTLSHYREAEPEQSRAWNARRKFIARRTGFGQPLTLELRPWRKLLWSPEERIPDAQRLMPRQRIVALSHVDSDEKILVVDLFSSTRHVLLAFELLKPAYGRENEWWEWVCESISRAKGNILTASSSSRIDGGWSTIHVDVVFPLDEKCNDNDGEGYVGRILDCVKSLQGDRWFTEEFVSHCENLFRDARYPRNQADPRGRDQRALGPAGGARTDAGGSSEGASGSERSSLKGRNRSARKGREEFEAIYREQSPEAAIFASTLQDVQILDPRFERSQVRGWAGQFRSNPFSFTRPLDSDRYERLYGELNEKKDGPAEDVLDSQTPGQRFLEAMAQQELGCAPTPRMRHRLARHICNKLTAPEGENVAIVGAPRAGKTTVLNLVFELLEQRARRFGEGDGSGDGGAENSGEDHASEEGGTPRPTVTLPVRINAATTSPLGLFVEIHRQLEQWVETPGPHDSERLRAASGRVKEPLNMFQEKLRTVTEMSLSLGFAGLKLKGLGDEFDDLKKLAEENPAEVLRALTWRQGDASFLQTTDVLKMSLEGLQAALQKASAPSEGEETNPVIQLAVIVDEVSVLSAWGQAGAFPVWRHVVETKEFSNLRWLISTSRPLDEAIDHSPITNVFREYNVGSLGIEECDLLLRSFSETPPESHKLAPLLTYYARVFISQITSRLPYLLQFVCYHLYDRGRRTHFPVLSRRVCRRLTRTVILPELSDYLEHQWAQIPDEIQEMIVAKLPAQEPAELLRSYSTTLKIADPLPPRAVKALARSGLKGEDEYYLAPLVAAWLLSTRAALRDTTRED